MPDRPDGEVLAKVAREARGLVEERFGDRLRELEKGFREVKSWDEDRIRELMAERAECLDLLDRFERRFLMELETRARPDGFVDWQAVREAVREWDPEEEEGGA